MAAAVTPLDMSTQGGGPARGDGLQNAFLPDGDRIAGHRFAGHLRIVNAKNWGGVERVGRSKQPSALPELRSLQRSGRAGTDLRDLIPAHVSIPDDGRCVSAER